MYVRVYDRNDIVTGGQREPTYRTEQTEYTAYTGELLASERVYMYRENI